MLHSFFFFFNPKFLFFFFVDFFLSEREKDINQNSNRVVLACP